MAKPVIAIDDLDELAMPVQALQGERIAVHRGLLGEPGDGALEPLEGDFELAGIVLRPLN
jgi:hypothetical protein